MKSGFAGSVEKFDAALTTNRVVLTTLPITTSSINIMIELLIVLNDMQTVGIFRMYKKEWISKILLWLYLPV